MGPVFICKYSLGLIRELMAKKHISIAGDVLFLHEFYRLYTYIRKCDLFPSVTSTKK